ncbi:MAG: WYL domain-containing protein [Oscillospiraceae bacterium]|nr:WYL domain-containing protein [Oscillospiraceae bacterium]
MKGGAIFQLLVILHEETDAQHRMSQQMLLERMQDRFHVTLNRRTLKSYLDELKAAGFPLYAEQHIRQHSDGTEDLILTDWYLEPLFEVSELRLLCDLIEGMPAIPETQRELLTNKLLHLARPDFCKSDKRQIVYLHTPPAQQLLFSVEILCEAMQKNRMVKFRYGSYYLDAHCKPVLLPRCREDGTVREYMVSPYEIAVSDGRYYLICCKEPYRQLSNYRIDRISEISILEQFERLPISELEEQASYPKNLAEQLYMYSGAEEEIRFIADAQILGDILDWFGNEIQLAPAEAGKLAVTVHVNPTAMQHWALQYGKYVTVLTPLSLRDEITKAAKEICRRYEKLT